MLCWHILNCESQRGEVWGVQGLTFLSCCLTPPVWKIQFFHEVFRQKCLDVLVLHVKTIYRFLEVSTGTGSIVYSKGACTTHVFTVEKLYNISASRWKHSQENFSSDLYSRWICLYHCHKLQHNFRVLIRIR